MDLNNAGGTVPAKRIKIEEEEGGEERICQSHQEPLKLFCKDDQTPICVVCDKSKKHQGHKVLPMEEATQDYNKEIQRLLESLKKEKESILALRAMGAARGNEALKNITFELDRVAYLFKEAHRFLEDHMQLLLGLWQFLQQATEERQKQHAASLSEDIGHLESLIETAQGRWWQPDSPFLQEMKTTLTRFKKRKLPVSMGIFSQLEDRLTSLTRENTAVAKRLKEFEDSWPLEEVKSQMDFPVIAERPSGSKSALPFRVKKEEASSPAAKRRKIKQVIAPERNMKLQQPWRGQEWSLKPFVGSSESRIPSPPPSPSKMFSVNDEDVEKHHQKKSSFQCLLF